jgi:hypothetical protein
MVGEWISILPLAVFSGLAWGSARKAAKRKTGILRLLRHLNQLVSLPEFGKRRQRHLLLGAAPGGHLIEGLQPLQIALPFGEALAAARLPAFAEVGKDREIVARFIRGATTCFIGTRCWLL